MPHRPAACDASVTLGAARRLRAPASSASHSAITPARLISVASSVVFRHQLLGLPLKINVWANKCTWHDGCQCAWVGRVVGPEPVDGSRQPAAGKGDLPW
jgi:hypothetical protein